MRKAKGMYWILLFMLLGLALYQIVLIFWEAPQQRESGRWYSMAQPDPEANMLRPQKIFFTLGSEDGSYGRIAKQDESFEEVFQNAYDLIAFVLQNDESELKSIEELPWNQEACVLKYDWVMKNDLIRQQLELDQPMEEGHWSEIWVIPARSRDEKSVVYLLDLEAQVCLKAEKEAWDREQNHLLLELLQNQAALRNKDHFAVAKAWPEQSLNGGYLLEEAVHETAYTVQADVNLQINGKINMVQAKQYALQFFQYADTVKIKEGDDQVLCTNEKITVKVDHTGVVQYVETLTEEEMKAISMKEAYQLAVGFVKADLQWDNAFGLDFVFSGYEVLEDRYIFYFNYLFGGIPYQMEEDAAMQNMAAPICVTVEGSRVRRYERYVLSAAVDQSSQYTLEQTWQDVMNETAAEGRVLKGVPELKYYFEKKRMVLYWEIDTDQGEVRWKAR